MPGTLFVVATPIGNLEDFTFRGVRTLKEVHLIAAEDTRRTAKLLAHYAIQKPVVSLREHNESRETGRLIARLQGGEDIALVSDAGTPTIADPGQTLVGAAHAAGIRVVPIPGASAITTALSISGLSADQFVFLGFPPASGQRRVEWFESLTNEPKTIVFYEAPHRISRTIQELFKLAGIRPIIVCRELTKINEELVIWGNKGHLIERGEFAVVVGPHPSARVEEPDDACVALLFGQIAESTGLPEESVLTMVAARFGIPETKAGKLVKKGRIRAKRAQDSQSA